MKNNVPAFSLLKSNYPTVEADADLTVIRHVFNRFPDSFLPVVRDGKFVGVILREDFLRKFVASDDYRLTAKDLISKEIVKLLPENTLTDAFEIFDTNIFSVLPIADGQDKLMGLLLKEDLERHLLAVPSKLRERFARLRKIVAAPLP
ncbi:MAG: CBS domain-containing protein [Saprospiraceae bacterium]|jgi:CBS domain-containing protein|nr:CBS domain-containing protein [Saprospiraceae bacterium]